MLWKLRRPSSPCANVVVAPPRVTCGLELEAEGSKQKQKQKQPPPPLQSATSGGMGGRGEGGGERSDELCDVGDNPAHDMHPAHGGTKGTG